MDAFSQDMPYRIEDKRPGDIPEFYANPQKAYKEIGWKTRKSIQDILKDTWKWHTA